MLSTALTDQAQALIDALGTNAFLVDVLPDGGFAFAGVNRRYEAFTGLKASEIIGRRLQEVLSPATAAQAEVAFRRCVEDRQPASYEVSWGGTAASQWREITVVPMLDGDGEVRRLFGHAVDIARRKQAEERLDLMLQNIPALISYIDKDQRHQFANRAYAEWLRRPRAELMGLRLSDVSGQAAVDEVRSVADALSGKESVRESEVDWPGRGRRSVQTAYIPDRIADQPVRGVQVVTTDVTEQRRTQAALRATEANLSAVFSAAADPLLLLDTTGLVLASNAAAARRFGTTPETLIGHRFWEFAPEAERVRLAAEIAYAVEHKAPVWYEVDQGGRIFEEVTYPVFDDQGNVVRLAGCARDITDQKHAQEILHRRDAILEAVAFAAGRFLSASSWEDCIDEVLERLGEAAHVSRAYIFENGMSPEGELVMSQYREWTASGIESHIDNPAFQAVPYRAGGFARWQEHLGEGKPVVDFLEWLPRSAAGNLSPQGVRSIAAVPLMVGDAWWGFIGFEDRDPERIWERAEIDALKTAAATLGAAFRRQQTDDALHASETRYQLAISAGTVAIWDWHIKDDALLGSVDFPHKLGYGEDDVPATLADWLQLVHPDDQSGTLTALQDYVEGRSKDFQREFRLMQKDGSFRWFIGRGAIVVRDEAGRPVRMAGTLTDIAELKRTEEALWRRTEDLAVANDELKSFTHIVSHDLRSPLITIKGFSSELKILLGELTEVMGRLLPSADAGDQAEARQLLESQMPKALAYVVNAASKMESQLAAILKLARLGRTEPGREFVDVGTVVAEVLEGLSFQIQKRQATVTVQTLPPACTDREVVALVFGNLLSNALNYLDKRRPGVIEVWAETDELRTVFKVRDNGRGIAKNDLLKIFDIFRRVGSSDVQGEGVGLTYARAAARRCGGDLWAESEAGVGSTFSFSVPNLPPVPVRAGLVS